MKKPVLYVEAVPFEKHKLLFDFCYSAQLGAQQVGIDVKPFSSVDDIPGYPTNIIVGSVECCSEWLEKNEFVVPTLPDISLFKDFLGREISVVDIKDVKYPSFIKPLSKIKAFTGFVAVDKLYIDIFAEKYDGLVSSQEIVEIESEYRMYINCKKIVGMKHYRGNCLVFPDGKFIQDCVDFSNSILDNHSYTLDFGVLEDGSTILIEVNDGWAIGNYGLEPLDYYYFVRNRWLQITGIRTRME